MAVYKEGFHAIQTIETRSIQIFKDACDFGMPVCKGDNGWNTVKQLVEFYAVENTRKVHRYYRGLTVETDVELVDEWRKPFLTYRFRVTYVHASKPFKVKGEEFTGYVYVTELPTK